MNTQEKIMWWSPEVGEEELQNVSKVIKENYLNEGDVTEQFEKEISSLLGVKYAISTTSGTTALFLALKAHNIGPGDEVIVPDLTFIATANAVSLAGAKPVLVDIDPNTFNISIEAVSKAITKKTKAVIPVHVSGRIADVFALVEMSRKCGFVVIEDACEALGSKKNGVLAGTIGNAGCFSFSPNKTITTGQGGMVVTNDDKIALVLREQKDQGRPTRGTGGDDIHYSIGFNFKFTNLQAAIGLAQLRKLKKRQQRLCEIFKFYYRELGQIKELKLPGFDIDNGEIPQWVDLSIKNRDELTAIFDSNNILYRRFWHPIHRQLPYRENDNNFPHSIHVSQTSLWLPSSFSLTDIQLEKVCATIKDFILSKTPAEIAEKRG